MRRPGGFCGESFVFRRLCIFFVLPLLSEGLVLGQKPILLAKENAILFVILWTQERKIRKKSPKQLTKALSLGIIIFA